MNFPIESPVTALTLCLFIMMVVPPMCRRIGMPSIFGLILSGIIIGPKGFELIDYKSIELLSTGGLLYLMFLMTLEIDLFSFRKNMSKTAWFGVLTFIIPFLLGFLLTYYLFNFNIYASLLLSCMFSTHTLVSYPIASRLNITKSEPVVISIGGTVITDTTVLLLLTIIIKTYEDSLDAFFWVFLTLKLTTFLLTMLWIFPKLCRWYFTRFQSDETGQFIFVLTSLFASGLIAKLADIEPIVGAFVCGLILNRILPHKSMLKNRTSFVGNAIFIPFFLIHIGMLVDVRAFFDGHQAFILSAALVLMALFSKYFAAIATQLIYKYTRTEGLLLFGLSCSSAAATIAVIMVGYNRGIFDENIINATVLIILFTCLTSTYITDYAGRKVALQQEKSGNLELKPERILVPVSNPDTALSLFNIAIAVHQSNSNSIISPLSIATTFRGLEHSILNDELLAENFLNQANAANVDYRPAMRIDSNISEGIIRAAAEMRCTHVVLGWTGQSSTAQYFFGTIIDKLLSGCSQTIMVVNLNSSIINFGKIYVLIPRNAEHEQGFQTWLQLLHTLQQNTSGSLTLISDHKTIDGISRVKASAHLTENFNIVSPMPEMKTLAEDLSENDILVVISARPNTVSYSRRVALAPRVLSRYFGHTNSMILYPEQTEAAPDNMSVTFGGI